MLFHPNSCGSINTVWLGCIHQKQKEEIDFYKFCVTIYSYPIIFVFQDRQIIWYYF